MKAFILLFLVSSAYAQTLPPVNELVLEAVSEMPSKGGYVNTARSLRSMIAAFTWQDQVLKLDPTKSTPSYCTTATYQVFYKVLQKFWAQNNWEATYETLVLIKPKIEVDGTRIWGRWNANGPATAKFFQDASLGFNFDNIDKALPGDFLKIFWNDQVGKNERGHSVVYLGREIRNGVEMIQYWSTQTGTNGYGAQWIPKSKARRLLFSRFEHPENIARILELPVKDAFLASMLTRVSNWDEVRLVTGIQ